MAAVLLVPTMPELELLCRLPRHDQGRTPLLFVHGSFSAAWCWEEYFLPFFAEQGYPAYAVSLRGHGGSDGHEQLLSASLSDYVLDVVHTIRRLPKRPVLIGHSMGGMVVQKYLERRTVPGVMLLASVPPQGLLWSNLWLAMTDPLLLAQVSLLMTLGPYVCTPEMTRRALFSTEVPAAKVARYFNKMQQESQRVVVDMCGFDLPKTRDAYTPPALVLGAGDDALISPMMVQATAERFGVSAESFTGLGHAMMLESQWQSVAERMVRWLGEQGL